jgi:hypothetical protein
MIFCCHILLPSPRALLLCSILCRVHLASSKSSVHPLRAPSHAFNRAASRQNQRSADVPHPPVSHTDRVLYRAINAPVQRRSPPPTTARFMANTAGGFPVITEESEHQNIWAATSNSIRPAGRSHSITSEKQR